MVVVVDDERRENEGDLLMAAEKVTARDINFMATHGRGLICVPLARRQAVALELRPMAETNTDAQGTAFTVSVDHVSVTTGISAQERAVTARQCANPAATPGDFRRPGHIFPLEARNVYSTVDKRGGTLNLQKFTSKPPRAFFAQPGDSRDMLYSHMVHPVTGAEYLMVVNNQTHSNQGAVSHTINFTNAAGQKVQSLTEVSSNYSSRGFKAPVDLRTTHAATFTFQTGEGRLFRLDYAAGTTPTTPPV